MHLSLNIHKMSADTSDLSKVDSAVSGLSSSPTNTKTVPKAARKSSSAPGVMNINDLGKALPSLGGCAFPDDGAETEGTKIEIAPDTQKLNW